MKKIKQWLDNLKKRFEKDKEFQYAVKGQILLLFATVLLYTLCGFNLPEIGMMYLAYFVVEGVSKYGRQNK